MHVILIYLGILVGVVFEGEMIMISSIIAAHHGYVNIWIVIAIGIIGTFFTDTFYFFLGRKKGKHLLGKKEKIKNRMGLLIERLIKTLFLSFLVTALCMDLEVLHRWLLEVQIFIPVDF